MVPWKTKCLEDGSYFFSITREHSGPFSFLTQQNLVFKQRDWRAEWNVWFTYRGKKQSSVFSLGHLLSEDLHSLQSSQDEGWRPPRCCYGPALWSSPYAMWLRRWLTGLWMASEDLSLKSTTSFFGRTVAWDWFAFCQTPNPKLHSLFRTMDYWSVV